MSQKLYCEENYNKLIAAIIWQASDDLISGEKRHSARAFLRNAGARPLDVLKWAKLNKARYR